MRKVIITGLNGTLAPKLAHVLSQQKIDVVAWNRVEVNPEDAEASRKFVEAVQPDAICHLATGSANWCKILAGISASNEIRFLFTSTAMVFNHEPNGPHRAGDETTGRDDYGKNKIESEELILKHNPSAVIARIGWQIDWDASGNNMFNHLKNMITQDGVISASEIWYPATSMMSDTSAVLVNLLKGSAAGIYHIDSNRHDKLSFVDICERISKLHNLYWHIKSNRDYHHDQRLLDDRIDIPDISTRLQRSV